MDLKEMTYLNSRGERVTDSLIFRSEFGIREHNKVVRAIDNAIKVRLSNIEEIYGSGGSAISGDTPTDTEKQAFIQDLFIEMTYIEESNNQVYRKYEITEKGFYTLLGKIKGGNKEGVKRIDIAHGRFIEAFFSLRAELNSKLVAYKYLAEQFLPIDERGHISTFNGKERLHVVHGYFTSRKTRHEVTDEMQKAFDVIFKSNHKFATIEEVKRHEKQKPKNGTPSKAFLNYLIAGEIDADFINEVKYKEYQEWGI